MRFTILASALLFATLFLSRCGGTPFCSGKTTNTGSIVSNFTIPNCFKPLLIDQGEFVVKTLNDLDTTGCNLNQDPFDFQQFSLISKNVSGGCKLRIISRNLQIDHEAKRYTYTIKFKDCGFCMRQGIVPNPVLVPKIPDDYEVIFKVVEK